MAFQSISSVNRPPLLLAPLLPQTLRQLAQHKPCQFRRRLQQAEVTSRLTSSRLLLNRAKGTEGQRVQALAQAQELLKEQLPIWTSYAIAHTSSICDS